LDLLGVVTGSEGLLGIVVEVVVRILRKAPVTRTLMASFDTVAAAGACVAAIIADGVVPAAMEFMDGRAAEAIEAYNQPGYPAGAAAILIIDADGVEADVTQARARVTAIVAERGGKTVEATDEKQRTRIWSGRKAAFAAMAGEGDAFPCAEPRNVAIAGIKAAVARCHGLCGRFQHGGGDRIVLDAGRGVYWIIQGPAAGIVGLIVQVRPGEARGPFLEQDGGATVRFKPIIPSRQQVARRGNVRVRAAGDCGKQGGFHAFGHQAGGGELAALELGEGQFVCTSQQPG
jgi:FAD/FMN-containing dehydrogenase